MHHLGQNGRCGSLFGAGPRLLVVEYGHDARISGCRVCGVEQCFQSGIGHRQVVDACRLEILVVIAGGGGRFERIEAKFVFKNVFRTDAEIVGHEHLDYASFGFLVFYGLLVVESHYRLHVFLHREGIAFVYSTVEMDGKMRDESYRTLEIDESCNGVERIFSGGHHAS